MIQGEAIQTLRAAIAEKPDATPHEVRDAIGSGGCLVTLWRAVRRLNITRKNKDTSR